MAVRDYLRDPWESSPAFVRFFERRVDPWGYVRESERERYRRSLEMIERVAGRNSWGRVLEAGCAEGTFTELLAPRCGSLVAVDFVPLALSRARKRRNWEDRVRFVEMDLKNGELRGPFDLILVMSVLDHFYRPAALKAVREKLVQGLAPGGLLFVQNMRESDLFEKTWWGRRWLRGGLQINRFVGEHPLLATVETAVESFYVSSVYRKTG